MTDALFNEPNSLLFRGNILLNVRSAYLVKLTLFLLKSVDVILNLSNLLFHRRYFSVVLFHLEKQNIFFTIYTEKMMCFNA